VATPAKATISHTVRTNSVSNAAADSKAGLDALGVRLNAVIDALRAAGIFTP
jgi:hypothetical protein